MMELIVFCVLALSAVTAGIFVLVLGALVVLGGGSPPSKGTRTRRLGKSAAALGMLFLMTAAFAVYSQSTARTPAIKDERGNAVPGSIARLERVELNGTKQWISIRGLNRESPVLLFLAGGPGGSQMAAVRHDLAELEKHFVVVNWDQPGSGKSYGAKPIQDITKETYIEDGYALTKYLCEAFGQQKIYLVGESWGSALGIFLIDHAPEAYHAFIGTAQMVDFAETERMDYETAMELAEAAHDGDTAAKLESNGPPPYYGDDVTWKSAVYLNYLSAHMARHPGIQNPGYNTFRDIFSEEYGVLDKINYARGIVNTYGHVYQQLYGIDMRTDYTKLEVPVAFFVGRHDLNAPPSLVEAYESVLDAPSKELVWFEHSGHSPWINESDRFVKELLRFFSR